MNTNQSPAEAHGDKWEGAEEWMPLAWELCANECGEDACTELIWEGGPIPEPWGDRWLKYEGQAKEMIAMVRASLAAANPQPKGTAADAVAVPCTWKKPGESDDAWVDRITGAAPSPAPAHEPVAWQERQEIRPGVFGEWYDRRIPWGLNRPQEMDSGGIRYQFRPLYLHPAQCAAVGDARKDFEAWTVSFYAGLANAADTWDEQRKTYTDYAHHMAWCLWRYFAAQATAPAPQPERLIVHRDALTLAADVLTCATSFNSKKARDAHLGALEGLIDALAQHRHSLSRSTPTAVAHQHPEN